ncbi:AraC family transcriptional regulator N-terminal domain-containing protein [Streptomyces sp. NPDC020917]|uniref:AraC family transcriptional regulator n=1 Tax=Streptomyces sp. NPDC020917 TaxID=3365102 RepID=UPI0037B6DCDE
MAHDELRALLACHARSDGSTAIDGVMISKVEHPAPPAASTTGTVLAVVAQGAKRLALGDRVYDYHAGQYLVASVDLPVTGHFVDPRPEEPALGFGMDLRPEEIADVLLSAGAGQDPQPKTAATGIAVSDAPPELLDAVVRMVRLLESPRDIPVLAPLIKREILWRLISGEQGAVVRQLGLPNGGFSHMTRAIHWIRDNYATAFRVEDVARMAGMSTSAFHRNFQSVTAMSPIQFQKHIRLQEARLLLAGRPGAVTSVCHSVGYDSASQFSREYRRLFGVSPSEDARRMRGSDPGSWTSGASPAPQRDASPLP